ncbi:hypothetical protein BD769DRAFT_1382481 [Suillus cothurnatus]|nr:hypothetical protein BD769DRAFT_1382481 [Suillus cothurnatus]
MSGVSIGRQRAGAKRNYREEQILASNELALGATSGRSGEEWVLASNELALDAIQGGAGIGKQCAGAGRNFWEERVLASNALALDATDYKCDLARLPTGKGMHEYTEGVGETCSNVKRRIGVAQHGDTCNKACASSFSDDNQWELTHQWR